MEKVSKKVERYLIIEIPHHKALDFEYERNAQAVALTCKSVGNVTKNYFFRTGNGISVIDADLTCSNNLILNCCQSANHVDFKSTLGLFTGLCVKSKGNKVQILSNIIKVCNFHNQIPFIISFCVIHFCGRFYIMSCKN